MNNLYSFSIVKKAYYTVTFSMYLCGYCKKNNNRKYFFFRLQYSALFIILFFHTDYTTAEDVFAECLLLSKDRVCPGLYQFAESHTDFRTCDSGI